VCASARLSAGPLARLTTAAAEHRELIALMITETQLKLRDAGIQMKLALRNGRDEDFFRSCINSFIAAARSITMVMECESSAHHELLKWYKNETSTFGADPLFKFFNEQCVHTIHKGVVHPEKASFSMKGYVRAEKSDPDGGAVPMGRFDVEAPVPPIGVGDVVHTLSATEGIYWSFPEARQHFPVGSINVIRLCESYFVRLKDFVHRWLKTREQLGFRPAG
jgi:hypothetical protein